MRNATTAKAPSALAAPRPRAFPWLIVGLAVGLSLGGYWGRHQARTTTTASLAQTGLSEATRTLLQNLDVPVELRLYIPSNLEELPDSLAGFAGRVRLLVSEYERESSGKVALKELDPLTGTTAKASAGADGIIAFSGKNGNVCFLGIAVSQGGKKQSLPQLSLDWEAALESDLSRAIARLVASPASVATTARRSSAPANEPVDPAVSEEVLRTIPDLASRSFDEASKILREAALAEFTAQANEMQAKLGEAQRHVFEAQQKNSERDQKAAVQELQHIQSEQTEKLKEITARLQARITALGQLKGQSPSAP